MRKLILLCASFCAMVLLFSESPAWAQSVLWVASNGSDANVCSQTSPCLTFQGAINKGGVAQVRCLTSGNYGPITINGSITIDCGAGNIGTVSAIGSGTLAVSISTSSAATIVLRHLSLNGSNSAGIGISATTFASGTLIVEDCTIQGFTGNSGILFEPGGGRGLLQVSDTRIFNNGNGIFVDPLNNQIATVTLNRVELTGNSGNGLVLGGTVVAGTMRDSVAAGNAINGVFAAATQVFFTVEESSLVANLNAGIETETVGSIVNVGASTIGANGTGVLANPGSIISFGDNHMSDNGTDGNFTSTKALK